MGTIKQFEDLEVWQLSRSFCDEIFKVITTTPLSKDYKLKEQINGSSGSIMDNIAEGFERDGNREFKQFLSISKASCGEARSQLYRVFDRKYINEVEFENLKNQTLTMSRKINSFMTYLKNSDQKGRKYN